MADNRRPSTAAGKGGRRSGIAAGPSDDRPREKLFRQGEHQLSGAELLAILIGSGRVGEDALTLARRILARFKTFREMSHTDPRDWLEFKGMGPAKLARIRAALEIGRRFREVEVRASRRKISAPADIVEAYRDRLRDLKHEVFKVLLLDGRNRIIEDREIVQGTTNGAYPVLREILNEASRRFASGLVAMHNHPSGDPSPSREDREFTARLNEAAELLGLKLLDHVIFGDQPPYFSFTEQDLL